MFFFLKENLEVFLFLFYREKTHLQSMPVTQVLILRILRDLMRRRKTKKTVPHNNGQKEYWMKKKRQEERTLCTVLFCNFKCTGIYTSHMTLQCPLMKCRHFPPFFYCCIHSAYWDEFCLPGSGCTVFVVSVRVCNNILPLFWMPLNFTASYLNGDVTFCSL